MDLICGGAYQGKLEYARKTFGLADSDISYCSAEAEPDLSRRCLCRVEEYALRCLRAGMEPFLQYRPDAVLIFTDIFCGVVPTDAETRAWREAAGRLLTSLSAQADTVTRLFCSLPLRLK